MGNFTYWPASEAFSIAQIHFMLYRIGLMLAKALREFLLLILCDELGINDKQHQRSA